MSVAPPPSPPPLPPLICSALLQSHYGKISPACMQSHQEHQDKSFETQLSEAARYLTEEEGKTLLVVSRRHKRALLQEGPRCGLVALSMACDALLCNVAPLEDVFGAAVEAGFSKRGEMFSATSMASLCCRFLPAPRWHTTTLVDLASALGDKKSVFDLFASKSGVLLVPYDVGKDQRPCLDRGRSAHW